MLKKKTIVCILTILILVGSPTAGFGQEKSNIAQYLDQKLYEMVQDQVKGAVVAVVKDGEIALCKGYGFADEENGVLADPNHTAFRIGSISKTFVAIAVQQLIQNGKLDMHTSISRYLEDDFPKFKHEITMHHLLTHTAGFEDLVTGIAVDDPSKAEPLAVSIRQYMPAQKFVPGEVVSYSNYGIALAAYVVETVSGEAFDHYAQNHIITPLGMTKTSFKLDFDGVMISNAYKPNGKVTAEPIINLYPEGSTVSTANDMAKYMLWILGNSNVVLPPQAKNELFVQQFTMADEFEGVGYTWNRKAQNGKVYFEKKGETSNFFSRIVVYPHLNTAVFLSFNTYVPEAQLNSVMDQITMMLLGAENEKKLYFGKQTLDIRGHYISTRSNFQTPEKVINFLSPQVYFQISGSLANGFSMNGQKLLPIGENYYSSPIGNIKYIENNHSVYLATHSAISYVKTNWYENSLIQKLIVCFFAIMTLAMAIIRVRKETRYVIDRVLARVIIAKIAFFLMLACIILFGLSSFTLLNFEFFVKTCGIVILSLTIFGVFHTIRLRKRKVDMPVRILLYGWNLSSILFCLWMVQVNIL